jgi:alpha-L-fucosidase 2
MQSVVGATATTNSAGALSFTIPAGGQASIVLAAVTDRNNTNYFSAAQQQSQQATTNSLATLWQGHQSYWTNFWSKSFVQIPDQTIQNHWYAGLYLLAIGSGTNSPPPGLYGNLVTSTQPSWDGDYTLDYNFECLRLPEWPTITWK